MGESFHNSEQVRVDASENKDSNEIHDAFGAFSSTKKSHKDFESNIVSHSDDFGFFGTSKVENQNATFENNELDGVIGVSEHSNGMHKDVTENSTFDVFEGTSDENEERVTKKEWNGSYMSCHI